MEQHLEPILDEVDGIVESRIRAVVEPKHFKYFDACQFKLKALWYLGERINKLDKQYREHVVSILADKTHTLHSTQSYFPFFEAVEFENLLNQGKAYLDCFAKAIGSTFGELPNNLTKLEKVLDQKKQNKNSAESVAASDLLTKIRSHKIHLEGIVIDPGSGKKSIRDLVSHRERASIHFRVFSSGLSKSALVRSDHTETVRLTSNSVPVISKDVWHHSRKLAKDSFPIIVKLLEGQRENRS